VSEDRS